MHLTLVILSIFITTTTTQAERWIIKNPTDETNLRAAPLTLKDRIQFGKNEYWIVETELHPSDLRQRAKAESVTPDFEIRRIEGKTDSSSKSGGSFPAWHVDAMKYTQLPKSAEGKGIVVAVLDSGVDITHPSLKNQIWVNPDEIDGNGIDDDQNGYIDDIHGWDFPKQSPTIKDWMGHGTHCAGIIVAEKDPNSEARGVAPGAKIMSLSIFPPIAENKAFLSIAARAIRYATDNGANILSNSWRIYSSWKDYDPTPANLAILNDAIEYAEQREILFVAAAGNERNNVENPSDPVFPVNLPNFRLLVGVAASQEKGRPALFTNFGVNRVHVAAPGNMIVSTYLNHTWIPMSGTSMATPLVAGVLARALSGGLKPQIAFQDLVSTSSVDLQQEWPQLIRAQGVIDPSRFLFKL